MSTDRPDTVQNDEHESSHGRDATNSSVHPQPGLQEFQPYQASDFPSLLGVATVTQPAAIPSQPTRLAKPPKGRLLIGVVLVSIVAFGIYRFWDTFSRYQAYGTVTGRTIQVHPPWDGIVTQVFVQEGEHVRQSQLLARIDNYDLQRRRAQLSDELKVAHANLLAERSRMRWQTGLNAQRFQEASADYYDVWGKLLVEQSRLSQLRLEYDRQAKLKAAGAGSDQEFESASLAFQAHKEKTTKLSEQLLELKKRVDLGRGLLEDGNPQLEPHLAKIQALQAEFERSRVLLDQGDIRAPTDGVVVRRIRFPGEFSKADQPVLSILEDNSLEVVLYLPQKSSNKFSQNDEVGVQVKPFPETVLCTVTRTGDQFVPAPAHIERYYRANEKLLPVYLKPKSEFLNTAALRVAALPYVDLSSGGSADAMISLD